MYDNFKVQNYPNVLFSPEMTVRHLANSFTGDIVRGLNVEPGAGMQVIVRPGDAFIRYGSTKAPSARAVSLVDDFPVSIEPADASNPRIDLVVLFVSDKQLPVVVPPALPTSANLDGPGVAQVKIVRGTPSATPAQPNATAIASAIGSASFPYTVLGSVRVEKLVTVIAVAKVSDLRKTIIPTSLRKYVDANGWTVTHHSGNVRRFTKKIKSKVPAQGWPAAAQFIAELNTPLPVGETKDTVDYVSTSLGNDGSGTLKLTIENIDIDRINENHIVYSASAQIPANVGIWALYILESV